ncbi:hypothetical protein OMP38_14490 [Cohnella ginsengisoli]|uniref:Uncharacterized protein n=1 Tax=Cohnella ginsengisoli TaxID=425004 RepID=A0A9X4KLS5_9BACL|nr:hypothetical protein [Cohnella ginsengisoli]MDG0791925.1 hypothetical protein [Cohnella ginsengisoli]
MTYTVYAILSAVIGVLLLFMHKDRQDHRRHVESLQEERQKLLDRIQAPSFDHYKQAEVKVIKAQKEEPKREGDLIPV